MLSSCYECVCFIEHLWLSFSHSAPLLTLDPRRWRTVMTRKCHLHKLDPSESAEHPDRPPYTAGLGFFYSGLLRRKNALSMVRPPLVPLLLSVRSQSARS